jgi:hypothetical protein
MAAQIIFPGLLRRPFVDIVAGYALLRKCGNAGDEQEEND